jgi:hypothetical protein
VTPTPIGALVVFSGGQDSTTCWPGRSRASTAWRPWASTTASATARARMPRGCPRRPARPAPDWAQKLGSDTLLSLDVFRQLAKPPSPMMSRYP